MQSFVFGMLTVAGLVLLVGTIVGFVKIYKQGKTLKEHEEMHLHLERDTDQRINEGWRDVCERFEQVFRQLDELEGKVTSYTDSRCDKLEQKLTKQK